MIIFNYNNLFRIQRILENLFFEKRCPFSLYENCLAKNYVCKKCLRKFLDLDSFFPSKVLSKKLNQSTTVYSACLYKSLPKDTIQDLKWQSRKLAAPIAEIIQEFLQTKLNLIRTDLEPGLIDYLIPVPGLINEKRNWVPSLEISKFLSVLTRIKLIPDLLLKTQDTKFYRLKLKQRINLSKKSYIFNPKFKKKLKPEPKVLLIDDLCASGSTIRACVEILKARLSKPRITALTFAKSEI